MTREIPEFDVVEREDGSFEAYRRGAPATTAPSVTAPTFRALELECLAVRVTWTLTPQWRAR
ncbi:hypothetical protein ABT340_15625 [Streptosporangium sp. NPDC000239]|uniref:hypothetical protein n=1 Tax=Streptosporangium sp. NPDC000239 TaxID=3154248 RepID=UPI003322A3B4